ncbi:hypothetical protein OB955_11250 [Halobacteria archaeon AArc-m2/3/4]|uniref:Uncharacterized protein n=1 Tax=Natronoglomus mannanivorans TaxID=2979990 RepID=A0AAP3E1K4_9EURY|nr:hypothetical protein [Halobacteria archaeon AArc-xg1-1]MCU4973317.1 hypothetical protein [Halobacteria archaeon AArc-m2/3/4]
MPTVTACRKCGSENIGLGKRSRDFACDDCNWTATYEGLMEM